MTRKILLYGDVDLNIVDGSSIWLVNLAKLLWTDRENHVDILLKKRIRNRILTREIEKRYRIKLLYVKEYLDHMTEVDQRNIRKVLETIDGFRDYSMIILRGMNVVREAAKSPLIEKIVPYLTDFTQQRMPEKEKLFLRQLYEHVRAYFVQTEEMKDYLKRVLQVDGQKFWVLSPVVFTELSKQRRENTIVYAGKIARGWNIRELLAMMEELKKTRPDVRLYFIGDKVNRDMYGEKEVIFRALKEADNITFCGALPHKEAAALAGSCALGYAFRSRDIDGEHSLEISVKLLEYCRSGVPVLARRTPMHERILGADYPLYVKSQEECTAKALLALKDKEIYERAREMTQKAGDLFAPRRIYESIRDALALYPKKRLRLLVCGHDLKFLKPLFPYFREAYELEVYEQEEYMEFQAKQAERPKERADIIWCEWLLTAAKWFCGHAFPHQSVFVRAHRFEVMRDYGYRLDINRLSKLITVSYYWMEEFTRKFKIPLEKCTVINNFIDTNLYETAKTEDARYHLALIGALPKRKGLAKAVRLLKILRETDERYCLHVPGKRPEEFPNTWNVPEERRYYEQVYADIKAWGLECAVSFDGWVDVPKFLSNIGYVLSLSDAKMPESFHVTPFEGMAAGSAALALKWEGIEYLYPEETVVESIEEMAERIQTLNRREDLYKEMTRRGRAFVRERYDIKHIWEQIFRLLETGGDYEELCDSNGQEESGIVPERQEAVPDV